MKAQTVVLCSLAVIFGSYIAGNGVIPSKEMKNRENNKVQKEECAVYSALLESFYVQNNANPVFIEQNTGIDTIGRELMDEELRYLEGALSVSEVKEITASFKRVNEQPTTLRDCFNLRVQALLLSKEDVNEITEVPGGWGAFHSKYPKQSLVALSRIGFNSAMNKALVYTASESGGKSGQGTFVLLIKENNAWVLKHTIVSWKS